MFETPDLIRLADRLAAHAGARIATIAENVANADTPGYRAKSLPDFADVLAAEPVAIPVAMRATRPGHLAPSPRELPGPRAVPAGGEASINGNTVSLEREMVNAAAARQQHEMALLVHSATTNVIRAALGRGS